MKYSKYENIYLIYRLYVHLCEKKNFVEKHNPCIYTPDTIKVQLGELMSVIGAPYVSRNDSKTATSPKLTPAWVALTETRNSEHST